MTGKEQIKVAKEFAKYWEGKGYEKGESQRFWIDLLQNVFGVENATHYITFEDQVHIDKRTGFIDGYIESTKVMIEQKSLGKNLREAIIQSDGSKLNPFQQAKRYIVELPVDKHPRWVITCNFAEFLIYDMNKPNGEPEQIFLKDLPKELYRLQFLVKQKSEILKKEEQISVEAGNLVGKLYDALIKQYKNPDSDESKRSLNMLCVRLVFCLYAEDAQIFDKHEMFGAYLKQFPTKEVHKKLRELFKVLDMTQEQREEYDPYMDDDLAAFPYVNGGLFADENIEIPRFTDEIVDILLNQASAGFDWSEISPTIFGAVFESTLHEKTRRSGGMHYTSVQNILKVVNPLFLDELRKELDEIKLIKVRKTKDSQLEEFRDKLASLTFLDPACGSGNFLTQTYIELRRLENEALKELIASESMHGQMLLGGGITPIKVGIQQFYGIEINDFAVSVAKTALWIAEHKMLRETETIMQVDLKFLPLKSYANIVEGNALRIDWNDVVPKEKLSYIMGNPPFIGSSVMAQGSEQKKDVQNVFSFLEKNDVQDLDYVTCWYKLATDYIVGTDVEVCFVSTNSITQGSQVPILWKALQNQQVVYINFAYQTFIWNSESNKKAAVHCVIICFSLKERVNKAIYENDTSKTVRNISPYLVEGDSIFLTARKTPICNVPEICFGNQPRDGGFFVLNDEEKDSILKKEPQLEKWIRFYVGATEFINKKSRWCFWLKEATPRDIKSSKILCERVESVRQFRLSSKAKTTNGYAKVPHLFAQITQGECNSYIIVPNHSSERRRYIPIGFMDGKIISSNAVQIIPNATLYHFGVLTSNVHMAWMRTVCGRLKSDYRYSKEIVYNNFPWCNPTEKQRQQIEYTAQMILDAREKYLDCSLADLYDETTMPPELRKAHQANDKAVMIAYGFDYKTMTESECVAELMKMYQKLMGEK